MSWLKAKDWATGVEYSSLFHSGLRTISLRPRDRHARTSSSSSAESGSASSLASRMLRGSLAQTRCSSPSVSTSTDSSPPTSPSWIPRVAHSRPTKELEDEWSSGGSFEIEDPKLPKEEDVCGGYVLPPIDLGAVRSLAGSWPFFVNTGEMGEMEEESFLSLSNSRDVLLHHPIPWREPSASILTMPRPVLSRRSSLHHRTRDKGDCAWMLEESSPELEARDLGDEEEDERDWRQFHVEWVQSIR